MTKGTKRPGAAKPNGSGERVLIASIIWMAARDAKRGGDTGRDALAYFRGPIYKHHMSLLDLDPAMMPTGVQVTR